MSAAPPLDALFFELQQQKFDSLLPSKPINSADFLPEGNHFQDVPNPHPCLDAPTPVQPAIFEDPNTYLTGLTSAAVTAALNLLESNAQADAFAHVLDELEGAFDLTLENPAELHATRHLLSSILSKCADVLPQSYFTHPLWKEALFALLRLACEQKDSPSLLIAINLLQSSIATAAVHEDFLVHVPSAAFFTFKFTGSSSSSSSIPASPACHFFKVCRCLEDEQSKWAVIRQLSAVFSTHSFPSASSPPGKSKRSISIFIVMNSKERAQALSSAMNDFGVSTKFLESNSQINASSSSSSSSSSSHLSPQYFVTTHSVLTEEPQNLPKNCKLVIYHDMPLKDSVSSLPDAVSDTVPFLYLLSSSEERSMLPSQAAGKVIKKLPHDLNLWSETHMPVSEVLSNLCLNLASSLKGDVPLSTPSSSTTYLSTIKDALSFLKTTGKDTKQAKHFVAVCSALVTKAGEFLNEFPVSTAHSHTTKYIHTDIHNETLFVACSKCSKNCLSSHVPGHFVCQGQMESMGHSFRLDKDCSFHLCANCGLQSGQPLSGRRKPLPYHATRPIIDTLLACVFFASESEEIDAEWAASSCPSNALVGIGNWIISTPSSHGPLLLEQMASIAVKCLPLLQSPSTRMRSAAKQVISAAYRRFAANPATLHSLLIQPASSASSSSAADLATLRTFLSSSVFKGLSSSFDDDEQLQWAFEIFASVATAVSPHIWNLKKLLNPHESPAVPLAAASAPSASSSSSVPSPPFSPLANLVSYPPRRPDVSEPSEEEVQAWTTALNDSLRNFRPLASASVNEQPEGDRRGVAPHRGRDTSPPSHPSGPAPFSFGPPVPRTPSAAATPSAPSFSFGSPSVPPAPSAAAVAAAFYPTFQEKPIAAPSFYPSFYRKKTSAADVSSPAVMKEPELTAAERLEFITSFVRSTVEIFNTHCGRLVDEKKPRHPFARRVFNTLSNLLSDVICKNLVPLVQTPQVIHQVGDILNHILTAFEHFVHVNQSGGEKLMQALVLTLSSLPAAMLFHSIVSPSLPSAADVPFASSLFGTKKPHDAAVHMELDNLLSSISSPASIDAFKALLPSATLNDGIASAVTLARLHLRGHGSAISSFLKDHSTHPLSDEIRTLASHLFDTAKSQATMFSRQVISRKMMKEGGDELSEEELVEKKKAAHAALTAEVVAKCRLMLHYDADTFTPVMEAQLIQQCILNGSSASEWTASQVLDMWKTRTDEAKIRVLACTLLTKTIEIRKSNRLVCRVANSFVGTYIHCFQKHASTSEAAAAAPGPIPASHRPCPLDVLANFHAFDADSYPELHEAASRLSNLMLKTSCRLTENAGCFLQAKLQYGPQIYCQPDGALLTDVLPGIHWALTRSDGHQQIPVIVSLAMNMAMSLSSFQEGHPLIAQVAATCANMISSSLSAICDSQSAAPTTLLQLLGSIPLIARVHPAFRSEMASPGHSIVSKLMDLSHPDAMSKLRFFIQSTAVNALSSLIVDCQDPATIESIIRIMSILGERSQQMDPVVELSAAALKEQEQEQLIVVSQSDEELQEQEQVQADAVVDSPSIAQEPEVAAAASANANTPIPTPGRIVFAPSEEDVLSSIHGYFSDPLMFAAVANELDIISNPLQASWRTNTSELSDQYKYRSWAMTGMTPLASTSAAYYELTPRALGVVSATSATAAFTCGFMILPTDNPRHLLRLSGTLACLPVPVARAWTAGDRLGVLMVRQSSNRIRVLFIHNGQVLQELSENIVATASGSSSCFVVPVFALAADTVLDMHLTRDSWQFDIDAFVASELTTSVEPVPLAIAPAAVSSAAAAAAAAASSSNNDAADPPGSFRLKRNKQKPSESIIKLKRNAANSSTYNMAEMGIPLHEQALALFNQFASLLSSASHPSVRPMIDRFCFDAVSSAVTRPLDATIALTIMGGHYFASYPSAPLDGISSVAFSDRANRKLVIASLPNSSNSNSSAPSSSISYKIVSSRQSELLSTLDDKLNVSHPCLSTPEPKLIEALQSLLLAKTNDAPVLAELQAHASVVLNRFARKGLLPNGLHPALITLLATQAEQSEIGSSLPIQAYASELQSLLAMAASQPRRSTPTRFIPSASASPSRSPSASPAAPATCKGCSRILSDQSQPIYAILDDVDQHSDSKRPLEAELCLTTLSAQSPSLYCKSCAHSVPQIANNPAYIYHPTNMSGTRTLPDVRNLDALVKSPAADKEASFCSSCLMGFLPLENRFYDVSGSHFMSSSHAAHDIIIPVEQKQEFISADDADGSGSEGLHHTRSCLADVPCSSPVLCNVCFASASDPLRCYLRLHFAVPVSQLPIAASSADARSCIDPASLLTGCWVEYQVTQEGTLLSPSDIKAANEKSRADGGAAAASVHERHAAKEDLYDKFGSELQAASSSSSIIQVPTAAFNYSRVVAVRPKHKSAILESPLGSPSSSSVITLPLHSVWPVSDISSPSALSTRVLALTASIKAIASRRLLAALQQTNHLPLSSIGKLSPQESIRSLVNTLRGIIAGDDASALESPLSEMASDHSIRWMLNGFARMIREDTVLRRMGMHTKLQSSNDSLASAAAHRWRSVARARSRSPPVYARRRSLSPVLARAVETVETVINQHRDEVLLSTRLNASFSSILVSELISAISALPKRVDQTGRYGKFDALGPVLLEFLLGFNPIFVSDLYTVGAFRTLAATCQDLYGAKLRDCSSSSSSSSAIEQSSTRQEPLTGFGVSLVDDDFIREFVEHRSEENERERIRRLKRRLPSLLIPRVERGVQRADHLLTSLGSEHLFTLLQNSELFEFAVAQAVDMRDDGEGFRRIVSEHLFSAAAAPHKTAAVIPNHIYKRLSNTIPIFLRRSAMISEEYKTEIHQIAAEFSAPVAVEAFASVSGMDQFKRKFRSLESNVRDSIALFALCRATSSPSSSSSSSASESTKRTIEQAETALQPLISFIQHCLLLTGQIKSEASIPAHILDSCRKSCSPPTEVQCMDKDPSLEVSPTDPFVMPLHNGQSAPLSQLRSRKVAYFSLNVMPGADIRITCECSGDPVRLWIGTSPMSLENCINKRTGSEGITIPSRMVQQGAYILAVRARRESLQNWRLTCTFNEQVHQVAAAAASPGFSTHIGKYLLDPIINNQRYYDAAIMRMLNRNPNVVHELSDSEVADISNGEAASSSSSSKRPSALNDIAPCVTKARAALITSFNKCFNGIFEAIASPSIPSCLVDLFARCRHLVSESAKARLLHSSLSSSSSNSSRPEITINRYNGVPVFAQVCKAFERYTPQQMRISGDRPFRVTLQGENATDAGGPGREVVTHMSKELMKSKRLGLFTRCTNAVKGLGVYQDAAVPCHLLPEASAEHAAYYKFLGRLMGLMLRTKSCLEVDFPPALYKVLVGDKPDLSDVEKEDSFHTSLLKKLSTLSEEEIEDLGLTFSIHEADGTSISELKPGGSSVAVTSANRSEFISLLRRHLLARYMPVYEAIKSGFYEVIPAGCLSLFSGSELERRIAGDKDVDLDLLRANTRYSGCSEQDEHVQFLWRALESFKSQRRQQFLRFTWGRSRLPLPGEFSSSMTIESSHARVTDVSLPTASTCGFSFKWPRYSTYEIAHAKLSFAIKNCLEIDNDGSGASFGNSSSFGNVEVFDEDDE